MDELITTWPPCPDCGALGPDHGPSGNECSVCGRGLELDTFRGALLASIQSIFPAPKGEPYTYSVAIMRDAYGFQARTVVNDNLTYGGGPTFDEALYSVNDWVASRSSRPPKMVGIHAETRDEWIAWHAAWKQRVADAG